MSFNLGDAPELLTAEEVAAVLRVKPATVYEAATKGRIPHVRLWAGNRRALIRFRRSDIERLIAERSTEVAENS